MGDAAIISSLRAAGLIGDETPDLVPLSGGVSCDVWKVATRDGPVVVKRALPKLRVAADWFAPVERAATEVAWLRRAAAVDPRRVPDVLAEMPGDHAFAVRFVADAPVWKDELIAGRVDVAFAAQVAHALAAIHAATAGEAATRTTFRTDAMFRALRIDPFILYVAERQPDHAEALRRIASDLDGRAVALVHGDVSPKNILVARDGPVFLDAECAVYGDPAFDLAFCATHLLLKAVWLDHAALREAAQALVAAYAKGVVWESRPRSADPRRYTHRRAAAGARRREVARAVSHRSPRPRYDPSPCACVAG